MTNRHNRLLFVGMARTQPLAVYLLLCRVNALAMQMLQARVSRGIAESKVL